jgi:purine nucleosidase
MLQLKPGQSSRVKGKQAQRGHAAKEKKKVIFIQDACLDDFLAIAALARAHKAGEIEWLGDVVVNADSVLPQSMDLTQTFHHDLGVTDVPVLLSRVRLFNAFPWLYRNDTWAMTTLDSIKAAMAEAEENGGLQYTSMDCGGCPEEYPDAHPWLVNTLANASDGSITLLTVATQTILKPVFEEHPELQAKVKEMVWMAGAINVRGNTESSSEPWAIGHGYSGMNEYAEWNVYGDAYAAKWVLEHASFPIYDIPLDVCDKIPVCNEVSCEFIELMNGSISDPLITGPDCPNGLIFDALNAAYAKFAAPAPFYRLWDSAATAYVLRPDLFLDEGETPLACITEWSYEGWLAQPGAPTSKGLEEPEIYKNVTVFFNLTSPADETRNELYKFLASAACGTAAP